MPHAAESVPYVTAVLVAHDGARWLASALDAVGEQTRPPDAVVAVDTGSRDSSADLLEAALGGAAVVRADRGTGFGAAVDAGLAAAPAPPPDRRQWIWLLHDDCAPDPDVLARLLAAVDGSPSVAMVGPKAVRWSAPRRLAEVGLSADRAGRRRTGLEPGELDQGQHDTARDVLAVGTAGALIRRSAWAALGGLDPRLPVLGDDLDLGIRLNLAGARVLVCPAARVRHAQALTTGRRSGGPRRATRALVRRHEVYVRLVNCAAARLPAVALAALLGGFLRGTVLLLTRRPTAAAAEAAAAVRVLGSPATLLAGRRFRAGTRRLPDRHLRPLLAPRAAGVRAGVAALADWATGGGAEPAGSRHGALETGPGDQEDELVPPDGPGPLRRLLAQRGVQLGLALTVVGVVADRHLLGAGPLAGGRLLPAPASAGALWSSWVSSWHAAGLGSSSSAPAWTPWLALAATVLGYRTALAVTLLLVLALPLAGVAAYRAARLVTPASGLRAVAGASYALLSGLPQAVAGGRFDVVVAVIAIPGLLAAGARLAAEDPARTGLRRAFALGLGLAVALSFDPALAPPAALLLVAAGLGHRRAGVGHRRVLAMLVAAAVPVLLLAPTTLLLVHHPQALLVGWGGAGQLAGASGGVPGPASLLLLHPSGHPLPAWAALLAIPLLITALVGLVRIRRPVALVGFGIAAAGWAAAVLDSRIATPPGHGYPGTGLALAAAGLLTAGLVAGENGRRALARRPFGLVQPVAGVTAAAAIVAPIAVAAVLLNRGGGLPVHRPAANPVPAYVVAQSSFDPGLRALVLTGDTAAVPQVRYWAGPVGGPGLGDEDLADEPAAARVLGRAVRDLAAPLGTDAAGVLAAMQVGYVVVPAPASPRLTAALDAQPGLSRLATPSGRLWQVAGVAGRLEVLTRTSKASRVRLIAAGPTDIRAVLPAGGPGRLLVLADGADGGWQARLEGGGLVSSRAGGWAQAFRLPATDRPEILAVTHPAGGLWLVRGLQIAGFALLLVLAAPQAGSRRVPEVIDLTEPAVRERVPV